MMTGTNDPLRRRPAVCRGDRSEMNRQGEKTKENPHGGMSNDAGFGAKCEGDLEISFLL